MDAALKASFPRAEAEPFIVLPDTDQNVSKSLFRVSRFENIVSITTASPHARKRAWKLFLLFLIAKHPNFHFCSNAHDTIALKTPGFDLSGFPTVIKTFLASSSHTATIKHNRFALDVLCDFITSHSPTQAITDLMFISRSITAQEYSGADRASYAGYTAMKKQFMHLCGCISYKISPNKFEIGGRLTTFGGFQQFRMNKSVAETSKRNQR